MAAPDFRIREELVPVSLVLLSFIPLFLMGCILDISLIHFYSLVKGNATNMNILSKWVFELMAGHRFLPQEIMACLWLCMILSYIVAAFRCNNQQQRRIRVIYSLLVFWGVALTLGLCIALACLQPFDLMLARVEGESAFGKTIHALLFGELMMIPIIPACLYFWRKTHFSGAKAATEQP